MSVAPSSWHRSSTKASTKKVQRLGQHHSKCHPTSCIFFYSKESSEHPDKFPKPGQVQAQGRRVVEHWGNLIVLFVHCICQIVTKVSWRIQPFSGNQRFSSTHSWSRSRPRRSSASSLLIPSRSERVAWYDVAGVKKRHLPDGTWWKLDEVKDCQHLWMPCQCSDATTQSWLYDSAVHLHLEAAERT